MKIIISNENENAHYFIRIGFAKALSACGHDVRIWDLRKKSVFDAFDEHPDMDILVTQTYNINKAMFKCIEARPWIKVTMKGSDWGIAQDSMDLAKYPILTANQQEVQTILSLHDKVGKPDFIDIHYHQNSVNHTHSEWIKHGIKCVGLMSAADISDYHSGTQKEELKCDIGYVGGYWYYKSHTINQYLIPLCQQTYDYKIKIFGNQSWGVPQYCGVIPTEEVRNLFVSSTICPNISEPHSQVYGHDIVERPFKILSSKGFMITDYVQSMEDNVFFDNVVYAKSPQEFKEKVDFYLKNPEKRIEYIEKGYRCVLENHTYFHRAAQFFNELNLPFEAEKVNQTYLQIKKDLLCR